MRRLLALALVAVVVAGLFVPLAAADGDLEYGDERGDLQVDQPPWIDDDVAVDRTDNRTIYDVRGDEFYVELSNANHSDIDTYGVADGEASLEYDDDRDAWHVEPAGEGTIALYWIADEPVTDAAGNVTGTEQVRYAASLSVDDTEWTHLTDDEYEQTEQDAQNWSAVESEAESVAPDQPVDSTLSTGFAAVQFLDSPTAALSADIQGVLIMMTLRPGGLLVLGTFLALIAITAAQGFRWRHRFKQQLGEHDAVQHELDQAWLNKTKRILQQCDWPDLFPDHIAQRMHNLWGPNVWQGFKNYSLLRSPTHTKGLWLQMMAQLGYKGVVLRNLDGAVVEARAMTREEIDDEYGADYDVGSADETVDVPADDYQFDDGPVGDGGTLEMEIIEFDALRFDHRDHREIIDAVPADDMDETVFLESVEIDPERLSLPIDNHDIEDAELIQILDPDVPGDFESYEQFAEAQAQMLEFVTTHPLYTDTDGNVREEMDLLSFLAEMDSVLSDKADFDVADTQRKMLYWMAEQMDPNARLEETIADAQVDGLGRDDADDADVIGAEDVGLGDANPRGDRP